MFNTAGGGFSPQVSWVFPPVGCYYGPIPVMTGATLGGPSTRFGLRVHLRVDLIGLRPILILR